MNLLKRISRYIMLHSNYTENIGLLNGKMGAALFFFNLYRYSKENIYKKFAHEMISQIYDSTNDCSNWNFSNGLAGIAYGFEYLSYNKFIQLDSADVLSDADNILLNLSIKNLKVDNIYIELEGLFYYLFYRYSTYYYRNSIKFKYEKVIKEIIDVFSEQDSRAYSNLAFFLDNKDKFNFSLLMQNIVSETSSTEEDLFSKNCNISIGVGGYSGIGLNLIWENQKKK